MSSNSCPKTCDLLCVATILFSIGIVQLLAGIILLKSEDVYLLAGTDFAVAATNILIGSSLGIAANTWEKKKVTSCKRKNALACLYVTALSMNATGAIVMILGDGNKLLIAKEKVSEDFMFEVTAISYVTSVCSPIVCVVIALVCLSGIRIQIYDKMKKKDSLTKAESYGWVFENNHDTRSKNLGAILQDSTIRNASVSDDNVFLERRSVGGNLMRVKPSKRTKKNKPKDSVTSVSELISPLEIWNRKRNKIMKEITSPKPMFFTDDYLQFPDFKYDSYIGTKIPRITETSFIRTGSGGSRQTEETANSENLEHQIEKTMSCISSKPHLDELNLKLGSRRMSYPDSSCFIDNIDCFEEKLDNLPEMAFKDSKKSFDEPDGPTSHTVHSKLQRTREDLSDKTAQHLKQHAVCFDFEAIDSPKFPSVSRDTLGSRSCSDRYENPHRARRNSNDSSSSGLTAETISELKAKINKISYVEDENLELNREFLRSFKQNKIKSHLSESDIRDDRNNFQKLHAQYGVFSQNSESDSKIRLAGEVVPISIRPAVINRANSIPLKTICSQAINRYSVNLKNKSSDQRLNTDPDDAILSTNSESQSCQRTFSSSFKERSAHESDTEPKNSAKHSEQKFDFKQRMSIMGSIAESPTEEFLQNDLLNSDGTDSEFYSSSSPTENNERDSPKNRLKRAANSFSLKRLSSKAAPSLLNRLWSMKRTDAKTDFSGLIMDSDSLVGLNDEELMARTRRIRQLRKSVELRSKLEKHDDVV